MRKIITVAALAALAACTTTAGQDGDIVDGVSRYETLPSVTLWKIHGETTSGRELALVEAELGTRNETHAAGDYLGARTAGGYGKRTYPRTGVAVAGDRDCSDFASSAAAQKFFILTGGPTHDPHDLDRDGDGLACEWGPRLVSIATRYGSYRAYTPPRRYTAPATCYTGPRGGTYTITGSGNKNYDGC